MSNAGFEPARVQCVPVKKYVQHFHKNQNLKITTQDYSRQYLLAFTREKLPLF